MNWFKRLCLFVFGVAGILALVGLLAPWWGPYTREATELMDVADYWTAITAVSAITGVGCLVCLLRALFSPRNHKYITISRDGGDEITVTRAAIASQAQHIVERDGTCVAGTVRVFARKRGHIRVFVRVTPRHELNVVDKGQELQAELDEGLARIASDKIKSVNLQFTEPQDMEDERQPSSPSYEDVGYDIPAQPQVQDAVPTASTDAAIERPSETGITVSMSSFHRGEGSSESSGSVGDEEAGEVQGTSAAVESEPPEAKAEVSPLAEEPAGAEVGASVGNEGQEPSVPVAEGSDGLGEPGASGEEG